MAHVTLSRSDRNRTILSLFVSLELVFQMLSIEFQIWCLNVRVRDLLLSSVKRATVGEKEKESDSLTLNAVIR